MTSHRTNRIRLVATAISAALLVGTMAGTAEAKVIGSGTSTCSPISSLFV